MRRDDQFGQVLRLRRAVGRCVVLLGGGLLQHPHNVELRERIATRNLEVKQYYRQLQLRLLQIIAWMFGEGLGIAPGVVSSAQHLPRILLALWQGDPEIAVAAWGSDLFNPGNIPNLRNAELTDEDVGALISTIASELLLPPVAGDAPARPDIQILGQVHEWMLELRLAVNQDDWSVSLESVPGHERRTSGSYFTPPDLVEHLLDRVLEPALDDCIVGQTLEAAEQRILQLRIVDPACGTGVFLLAAARRIARRLDLIRRQSGAVARNKSSPALPDVIAQCLY